MAQTICAIRAGSHAAIVSDEVSTRTGVDVRGIRLGIGRECTSFILGVGSEDVEKVHRATTASRVKPTYVDHPVAINRNGGHQTLPRCDIIDTDRVGEGGQRGRQSGTDKSSARVSSGLVCVHVINESSARYRTHGQGRKAVIAIGSTKA